MRCWPAAFLPWLQLVFLAVALMLRSSFVLSVAVGGTYNFSIGGSSHLLVLLKAWELFRHLSL